MSDRQRHLRPDTVFFLLGDYFELNALYSVVRNDMDGFGEAIEDVHSFYECGSQESTQKYLMYGELFRR